MQEQTALGATAAPAPQGSVMMEKSLIPPTQGTLEELRLLRPRTAQFHAL